MTTHALNVMLCDTKRHILFKVLTKMLNMFKKKGTRDQYD